MDLKVSDFSSGDVWVFLIQIFILVGALLVGNSFRRKVSFLRKSLMPTALIGGLFLLLLKLIPSFSKMIDFTIMESVTYHSLAIGFIALALKKSKKQSKTSLKTIMETGVLQGAVYIIQAVVGLICTIIFSFVLVDGFFPGGGILLALGFGQGTGQALNYGKRFETEFGFVGGTTFGLSIATIGFIVASVVGVIYMNILRKKGKLTVSNKVLEEKLEDYVSENEIPNSESVDKFTINISLVLFVYTLVYIVMSIINVKLIWGFNFLLGTILAVSFKSILGFLQRKKIVHRNLTNDYLLDRISGFAFDLMIISGVASIDLDQLSDMILPLTVICILGSVVTFIYIRLASNHLYKGYENEAFFSLFGMLTGTASNGMILLREIDPSFETPASTNLVLSGLPAILFGGGLLILLEYCPRSLGWAITSLIILFVSFVIFTLILFRTKIFKKSKSEQETKTE